MNSDVSPFVVIATWVSRSGEEEAVKQALGRLADASRSEAGCLTYEVNRSLEDPKVFVIYEVYISREAFDAHASSEHFRVHAVEDGIPRLANRTRVFAQRSA